MKSKDRLFIPTAKEELISLAKVLRDRPILVQPWTRGKERKREGDKVTVGARSKD